MEHFSSAYKNRNLMKFLEALFSNNRLVIEPRITSSNVFWKFNAQFPDRWKANQLEMVIVIGWIAEPRQILSTTY